MLHVWFEEPYTPGLLVGGTTLTFWCTILDSLAVAMGFATVSFDEAFDSIICTVYQATPNLIFCHVRRSQRLYHFLLLTEIKHQVPASAQLWWKVDFAANLTRSGIHVSGHQVQCGRWEPKEGPRSSRRSCKESSSVTLKLTWCPHRCRASRTLGLSTLNGVVGTIRPVGFPKGNV